MWSESFTGTPPESPMNTDLIERVKSMRNRCEAILVLAAYGTMPDVVHTLLEDMGYSMQLILETYCAEKDEAVQLSHCTDNPFDCLGC